MVIKNFNKQKCKQWWGLHFIPFLTPIFGPLETTRTGHLSSLIEEFDGERDTLLLQEELIDSVTDLVSVGERGKSSLQAVANRLGCIDVSHYSSVLHDTRYFWSINSSWHCLRKDLSNLLHNVVLGYVCMPEENV